MWEKEFKVTREIAAVDKESAPTLNLLCAVEPDEVPTETEGFFASVLDYLGYGSPEDEEAVTVRTHELAEEGIVLPPIADRLFILEVHSEQVALVFECRDNELSLLVGNCDLTTKSAARLARGSSGEAASAE